MTIGNGPAPSGDPAYCQSLMPNRTIATSWDPDVVGDWVGDLEIWQGTSTSQSNLEFAGSRPYDSTQQIQFTINSSNAQQATVSGTTTLHFITAPLGFGAGTGRYVPVDAAGLPLIYCVSFDAVAATP